MPSEEKRTDSNGDERSRTARTPRLGATVIDEGTSFALWSTRATKAAVRIVDLASNTYQTVPLTARGDGLFTGVVGEIGEGAHYQFELDGAVFPDPYARFLPRGVHGPARIETRKAVTPLKTPLTLDRCILYEIHVGTFTPEGTYRAASAKLEEIAALGVTAIELMPISAFSGSRGWGYDGVAHFAPYAEYGEPDDLRAFLSKAHDLGLGVVLDVVYNHFGPDGNYLSAYSPEYFDPTIKTSWGDAPNFAHPRMREYVLENVRYWLSEYGFDGLRLDATHGIVDRESPHILEEIAGVAHGLAPRRIVFAEDDRNDPRLVTETGLDGLWADDFHHALRVLLTGEQDGYYAAYKPGTRELAQTIEKGWIYEGQVNPVTGVPRGAKAADLSGSNLVYCIQNHDQVGNRALGDRLHHDIAPDLYAAVSMLLLFLPMTPLLFMGQEWGAKAPFMYFTDHEPQLGEAISKGRREEFKGFASFRDSHVRASIPDPQAPSTFARSKLDWNERTHDESQRLLRLYRAMIHLRKVDAVLSVPSRSNLRCRVVGDSALVVRRSKGDEARSLVINFGDTEQAIECSSSPTKLIESRNDALRGHRMGAQSAVILGE